jgi:hypothetical protein
MISVIPAQAGIQSRHIGPPPGMICAVWFTTAVLGSGFRRNDGDLSYQSVLRTGCTLFAFAGADSAGMTDIHGFIAVFM